MLEVTLILVLVVAIARFVVTGSAGRTISGADRRDPRYAPGRDLAASLVKRHDLEPVTVRSGDMDAYLAREQVVQLADGCYRGQSLAAVAIAAHEVGHAVQHRDGALAWRLWWSLVPLTVGIGVAIAAALVVAVITATAWLNWVVLALLGLLVAAGLVSLKVERDATRWALDALRDTGQLDASQLSGAERVLRAGAALYVMETVWDPAYVIRRLLPERDPRSGGRSWWDSADGGGWGDGGGGDGGGGGA